MPLKIEHASLADGIALKIRGRDPWFSQHDLPFLRRAGVLIRYDRGTAGWDLFFGLQADFFLLPRILVTLRRLDPNFDARGLERDFHRLFLRFCALVDTGADATARLGRLARDLASRGLPPHDHQMDGAFEMIGRRFMVLSDELGLGKTLSTCLAVDALQSYPLLVVTKGAVKQEWEKEIKKCLPSVRVQVLEPRTNLSPGVSIYVTNFQNLKICINKIDGGFAAVVFDESHELQSLDSQRVQYSLRLARAAYRVYLVTGTFTRAFPADLYAQLLLLRCPAANDRMSYLTRYCDGHFEEIPCPRSEATNDDEARPTRKVFTIGGASNQSEFGELMSGYVLRRTKEDVARLPKKNISWINYQVPWNHYYFEVQARFRRLSPKRRLGAMATLVSEIAVAKTDETIRQVKAALEKHPKVVAFTGSIPAAEILARAFPDAVLLPGGITSRQRRERLAAFNDPSGPRLTIASVKASGAGQNLQAASAEVINDLPYTADDLQQTIDRIHRLGQTRDCDIGIIFAPGTIDEVVRAILLEKVHFAEALNQWCEANSRRTRGLARTYV